MMGHTLAPVTREDAARAIVMVDHEGLGRTFEVVMREQAQRWLRLRREARTAPTPMDRSAARVSAYYAGRDLAVLLAVRRAYRHTRRRQ